MDHHILVPCRICGRPATGVHYGVLSCRGCKVFYKRGLSRKPPYICYIGGGTCSTLASHKHQCKGCRFQKCIAMGMEIREHVSLPRSTRTLRGSALRDRSRTNSGVVLNSDSVTPSASDNEADLAGQLLVSDLEYPLLELEDLYNYLDTPIYRTISVDASRSSDCFSGGSLDMSYCRYPHFLGVEQSGSDNVIPIGARHLGFPGQLDYLIRSNGDCGSRPYDRDLYNLLNNKRLGSEAGRSEFLPFLDRCIGHYEDNRRQMSSTVQAVEAAIERVFRDHIDSWTVSRDQALLYGLVVNQPQTTIDNMVTAANRHTIEITMRAQRFASMLPGMEELHPSDKTATMQGWKLMVFWMLHHAPFMTEVETYITMGEEQYQYCRYWQEIFSEQIQLVTFVYRFCTEFRKIGLQQTEQYLLMSIVMFEPGQDTSPDQSLRMKIIHRHYLDVLMDVIKRRCSDTSQVAQIGERLERFFDILKLVHQLHIQYFDKSTARRKDLHQAETLSHRADETTIRCAEVALARMTITKYLGTGNFRRDKPIEAAPQFSPQTGIHQEVCH